jgi:RNA polymerase sporulation-specific sigma factor
VPRSLRDTAYQVLKTRGELEKEHKDSSIESIALKMNVAVTDVVYALDAISDTVSLFDPVFNSQDDTLLLMDQLGDEKNTDERWTENVCLDTAIQKLDERERKIIYLRYYEGKTQTEISEEIGISQAQVSRLEKTALSYIKNSIRA